MVADLHSSMKWLINDDISVWSDASGKCGCMALWRGSWFQVTLEKYPKAQQWDIAVKELLLIILVTSVWGNPGVAPSYNSAVTMLQ